MKSAARAVFSTSVAAGRLLVIRERGSVYVVLVDANQPASEKQGYDCRQG